MNGLTFFASTGLAGQVRGQQMAEYLGVKLNPLDGYYEDTCIWVRCSPANRPNHPIPKRNYVDIIDNIEHLGWLKQHPDIHIIAQSERGKQYLAKQLPNTNIIIIPHQHCNYERLRNQKRDPKIVAVIGHKEWTFQHPYEDIEKRLDEIGLEFWERHTYKQVYSFRRGKRSVHHSARILLCIIYQDIDIQIIWRKTMVESDIAFRNTLKLANAGSFGIPTVSYPEPVYMDEWNGCFLPVESIDELVSKVKQLKDDPELYEHISLKAIEASEKYYVEHIANMYRNLAKEGEGNGS